jgi:uncharacterized membrane protein
MELLDFIGQGVCHQDPDRSPGDTWLCHRCNALYLGGVLGLSHAPWLAKVAGLGAQLLLFGLLVTPIAFDGVVLGRGSALDQPWFRVLTGAIAGLGSGLLFGGVGWEAVRWPRPPGGLRRIWIPAWLLLVAGLIMYRAGWPVLLDLGVLAGLAGLCAAATAAVLRGVLALRRRLWRVPPPTESASLAAAWLVPLVALELLASSLLPSSWKPTTSWIWTAVDWLRGSGG